MSDHGHSDEAAKKRGRVRRGTKGKPEGLPPVTLPFIGRQSELQALDEAHAAGRVSGGDREFAISMIIGAPGVGKTRLAIEWAHQNKSQFPDGQLYVDLHGHSPLDGPIPATVAIRDLLNALGVASEALPADQDAQAAMYRSLVADRRMIIVLDNAATAEQVIPLLPGTATCAVLITSRTELSTLADRDGARLMQVGDLNDIESRALLKAVLGSDRVEADEDAVAELITLCGRLPLTLRIVAARATAASHLSLAEIVADLREPSLSAFDSDDPHTSLPAVLSWSLRPLTDEQRSLFGLLGIAPGPDFALSAVSALIGVSPARAGAALSTLVDASLVQRRPDGRYAMHDLIRDYAARCADNDLAPEIRDAGLRRLVDYYLHTAHGADRMLSQRKDVLNLGQPEPGSYPDTIADADEAWKWFEAERNCLIAIQAHAMHVGRYAEVWQIALTMDTTQRRAGHVDDHLACWQAALTAAMRIGEPITVALAHRILGDACSRIGLHDGAVENLQRSLAITQQANDRAGQADSHFILAALRERLSDDRQALEHAMEALRIFRELGDVLREAEALNGVGRYYARLGDFDQGHECCQASLEMHRYHPNRSGEADALDNLGYIARHVGAYTRALHFYGDALQLRMELGDAYQQANTLATLGEICAELGQRRQARRHWEEARDQLVQQGRKGEADHVNQELTDLQRSSFGDDSGDAEEISIYTSGDGGESLRDAVVEVLEVAGYRIVARDLPERGSWFQRLFARGKEVGADKALQQMFEKAVRAGELKYIHTPRSESDEREANAIARLIEASGSHDEVVICTSSIVYVKTQGRIASWVLTEDEISKLKANPQLMRSPLKLLEALSALAQDCPPPDSERRGIGQIHFPPESSEEVD